MILNIQKNTSKITFDLHGNKTILTEQLSKKPLKIVNPKAQKNTAVCMLTSYGGGFVEGDVVELEVLCKANTTSIISSQANTRVYESNGIPCRQELTMNMEVNAFHVFFNDPLVMHNGGSFSQKNTINLSKGSVLLFIDWFSAGRTANGESFAFKSYETSTKIEVEKKPVLWDNFKITPEDMDVHAPGMFGDHASFLNLFLIGDLNAKKVKIIENSLFKFQEENKDEFTDLALNITRTNDKALVGRYSAKKITSLKKVVVALSKILAESELLNYDHLDRKY